MKIPYFRPWREWNIPKSTLQRRVKGLVQGIDHASGCKHIFSPDEEESWPEFVEDIGKAGFPTYTWQGEKSRI